MANEKKIAKSQKLLMSFLSDAEDLEKKWMEESDPKKKEKLNKKVQFKKSMVISCAEDIGKAGGSLQNIRDDMTERQQQIIQELFPYGVNSDNLAQQEKRLQIINAHKKRIEKLRKIEESCPPYDPNLPFKEKLKNKRFKMEKEIGWWLVVDSKKGNATYEPVWNYEEHFATTVEFSAEERRILEHCYQIGKEYDAYNQQRFAFLVNLGGSMKEFAENVNEWSDKNQAQKWSRNMYTMIFPNMIRDLHPEKKYSSAELESMGKELTRRFLQFIADRESLDQYRDHWNQLMQSPDIAHFSDHQKETLVLQTMIDTVGSEKAWFTAMYNNIPQTKEGIELLLNYSYEDLGLA